MMFHDKIVELSVTKALEDEKQLNFIVLWEQESSTGFIFCQESLQDS